MPLSRKTLLLALIACSTTPVSAATRTWPQLFGLPGPCSGTLQACIESAADGDEIVIAGDDVAFPDRYTRIDESVTVGRPLTIRAAPGIDAVFAAGRDLIVGSHPTTPMAVRIEGLVFERGRIEVRHAATGFGDYRIERVRFADVEGSRCAIDLRADAGSGGARFVVGENAITMAPGPAPRASGICVNNDGATRQDSVFRNRVLATARTNFGIFFTGAAGGPVTVQANQIIGEGFISGIEVGGVPVAASWTVQVDNNVVSGQRLPHPGTFGASLLLRVSQASYTVVNNTLVHGSVGMDVLANGSVSGVLANNLVAHHAIRGFGISGSSAAAISNRNNLVFGNANDFFAPGPGTRTDDPRIASPNHPRPADDSPVVNAGHNASIPPFVAFDADGERRIVLGTVDIGAFEVNAERAGVQVAPDGIASNASPIDTVALIPEHQPQVTPLRVPALGGANARQNLGVFRSGGATPWGAYFENFLVDLLPGYRFSVVAPVGSKTAHLHSTTSANVLDDGTQMTHPELDGRPFAIMTVTHRFALAPDPGQYHDHPLGLEYFGGRWSIRNQNLAEMQSGRHFHVMVAPVGSPNAFRVRTPASVSELRLEHPLLDDNACAAPIVSRVDDPDRAGRTQDPTPFTLDYRPGGSGAPGRWFIVAEGESSPAFVADAAFHVIVDGAQANRCRAPVPDGIFSDGYE